MNSLITMSAIVGKPTEKECFDYLKMLNDNGIEQVMLYPRSGCDIEYLSDEWFETVGYFIESAEKLGLAVWLYDDFNWPSGDAKGRVSAIEKFRSKTIYTEGENIGLISCNSRHSAGIFGESFFPDLLSEEAVEYFIKLTHEQYYKHFDRYFGNTIKGIFSDEPSFAYSCEDARLPYYNGIEADYKDIFGREYYNDLHNDPVMFKTGTMKLVSQRFEKCYVDKIASWCEAHNIFMTGHLMCDSHPISGAKFNGNLLKNLSRFTLPGIDNIESDLTVPELVSLFGTAEYASSKNGAMIELFALGPADMTFSKKRCMIYFSAAHKIDHYFLAVSHMNMCGNKFIKDYFNQFTDDQPDFEGTRLLAKEADIAAEIAKKDFEPDVFIVYPNDVCMKNINCREHLKTYYDRFFGILNAFKDSHIQWKFADNIMECKNRDYIEFNDEFNYIYKGDFYSDADSICDIIGRKSFVLNDNGENQKGIFLRRFSDGNFLAINLYAPQGLYEICGKKYYLDTYGVIYSDTAEEYKKSSFCHEITNVFSVKYLNENMIRSMIINDQNEAIIDCKISTNVCFAVRNECDLYLDRENISCLSEESDLLFKGIRKLYHTSPKFILSEGRHTLKYENDLIYLPGVFLIGDFKAETNNGSICTVTLTDRIHDYIPGMKIHDYGVIEFETKIFIPEQTDFIELIGTTLYTKVYLDNIPIGDSIVSPYRFTIPQEYLGKNTTLTIRQHSSLGPIFGDTCYYRDNSKIVNWKTTPSTSETIFGFDKIIFGGK